jgi:drug/metabolite transporter (DMT)-like permease
MAAASAPDAAHSRRYVVPSFAALSLIWGSSFLFIKVGVDELHPMYITLIRVALGAAILLVLLVATRDRLPRGARVWGHMAVLGAIAVAVPFTLFGYGEQRVSSLLAGIWNATTPLVALPMAALVFRTERFTLRKVVGIGLGFAGVLVVLGVWQGVGGATLTGQLMCFGAAACYGIAIPYLKRFLADQPVSGLGLVAGQLVAATVMLAVVAPLAAGAPPAPADLSGEAVASMLALGALGTGAALVIHLRNIRLVGGTAASLVTYLMPVVAVLAGVIVLDETLTWFQPVGAVVVLSGIAISQGIRFRLRRARPVTPIPAPVTSPP